MSDGKNAFGTFFIVALCLIVVAGAVILIKKSSESKQDSGLSLSKSGEDKLKKQAPDSHDVIDGEYKVVKDAHKNTSDNKSLEETKQAFDKLVLDEHAEKIKRSEEQND